MSKTQNNKENTKIKVRIIGIRSNRLIVAIPPDGGRGIIPKREWSWDRGKDGHVLHFFEGQQVEAVFLENKSEESKPVLSIRELTNPWESFSQKFKKGDIVNGEIVNLRRYAAFVQIEPGITAVAWPKDIPLLPNQIPADDLLVGDKVRGQITVLDTEKRKIEISLIAPFRREPRPIDDRIRELIKLFEFDLEAFARQYTHQENRGEEDGPKAIAYPTPPLRHLKKVLIVDDSAHDSGYACKTMKEEFAGVEVLCVQTGEDALEMLNGDPSFDLVILDMSLENGHNGADVARKILHILPRIAIVFYSSNTLEDSQVLQLEEEYTRSFPFVKKTNHHNWQTNATDDDELIECIRNLRQGQVLKKQSIAAQSIETRLIDQFSNSAFGHQSLEDSLQQILSDLLHDTRVDNALILEVLSETKSVKLLAGLPLSREHLFFRSLDGLYYSPVRDVVEDEEVYYVGDLDEDSKKQRISNFFPGLFFKTCYCVPIKMPGQQARCALFVLDGRADLPWQVIARIRVAADYAALVFERHMFLDTLKQVEEFYSRGKLIGTLLHELNNKIQPLQGFVEDGEAILSRPDLAKNYVENIKTTIKDLFQLTESYGRLAKNEKEWVSISKVVEKVSAQLKPLASRAGVELITLPGKENLPEIYAMSVHIEQAIFNVALNAIQHLEEQKLNFQHINGIHGYTSDETLNDERLLVISTRYYEDNQVIEIAVLDSGPGIPFDWLEQMFQPKASTREGGQGLGLFISRNLIEAFGGQLVCTGSYRYCGSAFAMVFPVTNHQINGDK